MATPSVTVVGFDPRYAADFRRLNLAWIESLFRVEPPDEVMLSDPQRHIIDRGGQVLFLLENGQAVGTCALVPHGEEVELGKMAVDETCRGRGHGRRLMTAALDEARRMGARRVVLYTSTKLPPAIRLYESVGFRSIPVPQDNEYARADYAMALEL